MPNLSLNHSFTRNRVSRRRFLVGGTAVIAATGLFAQRRSFAAEELNLLIWCDHTDPNLLGPFEEQQGVRINFKEYSTTGTALALLEQSQPGDWDVFVVDSVDVPRVAKAGWLAELNQDDFPWDDIFPQLHDPDLHIINGKLYAVPEKFGYNTLAYNKEKVDPADMRRANVLWDPKYAGRIALYDYYIPTMEFVGLAIGIKPHEVTKDNLPAIKEKLFEMKDAGAIVLDVAAVQTALVTGDVDIVAGGGEWTVSVLHAEYPQLDWILPDDGGIRWGQSIGVFAGSKRKELATEFVKYILSPEGQARLATSACYWAMPANSKAALSDEEKAILRWDEQPGFIAKSYPYYIPDAELDAAMLEVWTEVMAR